MTKIKIIDTTLRDGEQTPGVAFTLQEKRDIVKCLLTEVKVDIVELASSLVSKGEKETVREICMWAESAGMLNRIEVLGFVDNNRSVDWIDSCNGKIINLLAKGSLRHVELQLRKTPGQHIEDIRKTVDYARDKGFGVNAYLEDWSSGMRDSQDYVLELASALREIKVDRIMLPDTLGILSPDRTKEFVKKMADSFPGQWFDFHAHNDYGLSTANTLAAVNNGARGVHVTVNGLGERAGNAPIDEVVAVIRDHTKFTTGVDESKLFRISEMVEIYSKIRIPHNKPITGEDVFTHTAGVHADGDKKGNLYMNPLLPSRFGRKREYALGKLSGKASLEQNLKKLEMDLSEENKARVLERIIELGDKKEVITSEDLPFIIADVLDAPEDRKIRISRCSIESGRGVTPKASFVLEYIDRNLKEEAQGNGGYDAFMNALRNASGKIGLLLPKLVDYEVRIPPGGKTDAIVETTITWELAGKEKRRFKTIGVDTDQVIAAVKATEKMLNIVTRKE